MDKSWILLDRLSDVYDKGVEAFLEFPQSNNPNLDVIPCPCVLCTNFGHHSIKEVRYHLFAHGFDQNYRILTFHGEKQTKLDSSQTHERCHSKSIAPDFYDTKDMLHDAFTYHVEENPDSLKSLLEECEKPLYEGSKYNSLSGLLKYQHIKGEFGWSDASFDILLRAIKDTLPENNTMPSSLYEAKKLLKGVGLQYEKIHACPNDCVLFRKEHKDASECPTCRTSRWKKNTKNVPSNVLWYFPPIPRFRRMFSSSDIAHDLTWHAEGQVNNGTPTHPRDSPSWKVVDSTWKELGAEKRNLRLALSVDGPKQPGNNIDVYLAPLIEDLKLLWETGVRTYDAYKKEYFNLTAILLWTINDFPAYSNLSGCVTKGYYACPICATNTCSQWLPASKKVCFLGHRTFLPLKHPFRKRKKDFNNQQEKKYAPVILVVSAVCCFWRHWVLAVLDMDTTTCYYLDSGRPVNISQQTVNTQLKHIIETALVSYSAQIGTNKRVKMKWINVACPRQPGITECGYYVLKFMKEVIHGGVEVLKNNTIGCGKISYTDADIDEVREDWACFVTIFVM
ncbi:hypothetical protein LXL04_033612 [Taraxacum kok-saghyz]